MVCVNVYMYKKISLLRASMPTPMHYTPSTILQPLGSPYLHLEITGDEQLQVQ